MVLPPGVHFLSLTAAEVLLPSRVETREAVNHPTVLRGPPHGAQGSPAKEMHSARSASCAEVEIPGLCPEGSLIKSFGAYGDFCSVAAGASPVLRPPLYAARLVTHWSAGNGQLPWPAPLKTPPNPFLPIVLERQSMEFM